LETLLPTYMAKRKWSDRLKVVESRGLWNALGESPDGRPSLVVFSTPSCTACWRSTSGAV